MVSFRLNDEIVDVPSDALHLSAASYIRQYTQCKSVKVSCNEGGCGACAVELLSPGDASSVVAVNSCLLPVASLDGCQVLTSEGLGNSRTGFHEVQARLSAFHGTQCGFCSPGITVSTHAALMAAAHKAQAAANSSSSSSSSSDRSDGACNGVSSSSCSANSSEDGHQTLPCNQQQQEQQCNGVTGTVANGSNCQHSQGSANCKAKKAAAAAAGATRVTSAQVLGALDGNLCRCTGWRPIADCAKSFACDVDIEDLGLNSLSPDRLAPISLNELTPAALKHQHPQQQQQQQQREEGCFTMALQHLQPGSVLGPSSLQQLLQVLLAAAAAELPVHLLGGNTGAGLHKDQWGRLGSSVCVLLKGVRELQQVSVQQGSGTAEGRVKEPAAVPAGKNGFDSIDTYIGAGAYGSSGSNGQKAAAVKSGKLATSSSSSSSSGSVVVAGAGVTISRLLEVLEETADALQAQHNSSLNTGTAASNISNTAAPSAAAGEGDQVQDVSNLQYMICHMRRIAGTLVRNAATLGGHLALVRTSHLESDLVTLMTAAGAEVCVTAADGSCHWMDLADLCQADQQQQQDDILQLLDKQQAVITAVKLPLPISNTTSTSSSSSSIAFWSHKVTVHRQYNEHAAVNASIWLEGPHTGCDNISSSSSTDPASASATAAAGGYTLRIAVGTYQQQQTGVKQAPKRNGKNGVLADGQQQQQQQQGTVGHDKGVWMCTRAHALEAALLQALHQQQQQQLGLAPALLQVLSDIPALLLTDVTPAGRLATYVRRVLPGLILKGLAAVLPATLLDQLHQQPTDTCNGTSSSISSISPSLLLELRECAADELSAAVCGPVFQSGRQDLPVDLKAAPPLYWPIEKDGGELQASGEAVYSDDVPIVSGALHAAYVTSTVPHAQLVQVDWSTALSVPGVVGWVSPEDIPAGADVMIQEAWAGDRQPLFAHTHVTHVGQALGLILAKSPEAAQAGARKVHVTYGPPPVSSSSSKDTASGSNDSSSSSSKEGAAAEAADDGVEGVSAAAGGGSAGGGSGALTSLSAAVAAESWYDMCKFPGSDKASTGDAAAAMSSAARVLSGQVKAGSQRHFYMEPQVCVVTPDEGGRLQVVSSCQGCDIVMYGVCRALKLRHNEVHVTSKRVGGGFGGKAAAAVFHGAAAAVAAHKFRRQVRLVVPQSVDVSLNAGRCPMVMDWTAGLDDQGRVQALQLQLTLMDGAYGGGVVEAMSMKSVADSVYDVTHMDFKLRLARTNMPPRSTVRGPGKVSMIILLELMMQQLAAATGRDPDEYRQTHMLQLPQDALTAAGGAAAAAAAPAGSDNVSVPSPASVTADQQQQQQTGQDDQQQLIPHPKYLPNSIINSNSNSSSSSNDSSSNSSGLKTSLGQAIEVHHYTLPYMMQQVRASSDYAARRVAVDAFNSRHSSRKRGLALVPVRYPLYRGFYTGRVTIYTDGSVLLSHAGVEIGQGISSKVKQTAAATLGQLLPQEARASLLPYIRVSGGSTELSPHAGLAAGSTTSEGATAAIAAACDELVGRIRGAAEALEKEGKEVTWEAVVKGVCSPWEIVTPKVLLTASARSGFSGESAAPMAMYQSFGVGAAEVEVDCVTGERRLLRADIMFDAGKSVSPAIDMGQVEGAFMQGVGYMMSEEVLECEDTGANLTDSTWTYKPPGIAELPKVFNVSLLRDSPVHVPQRQQLSAKATGEPPLMMAAAVACALQDAVHAAWRQYDQQQQQQRGQAGEGPACWPVLELPATTVNILKALPPQLY